MPGTHISLEQRQHAHRQFTAGVSSAVIKKNQRKLFGTRARIPSRASIFRYGKAAGARRCRHFYPGQSLTRRHKRLLREAMERNARNSTSELSAMLRREEARSGISSRTDFARSTIDRFLSKELGQTVKILTVYDPRRDPCESARCRSALKRYPVKCLLVIDAMHSDTRKDSARRRGRSRRGTRAYARQFLGGDGKLRTILGVMTVEGMQVDMCGFLVRSSALDGLQTTPSF